VNVLFVDDEEFFRMMVREVLRVRLPDVTVIEARDGDAALDVLRREAVACVVSDLVMPGTDGVGLLTAMLNERMRVPLVFVSAHGGEQLRFPGLPRQVAKPADLGALCTTVDELVSDPAAARDAMPTLMGLVQALRWERRTCAIEVQSADDDGRSWRATLSLDCGTLRAARLTGLAPGGCEPELRGADAAVEAFAAQAPRLALVDGHVAGESDEIDLHLGQLFARAVARRKARGTPVPE
jgi:CheY-like chemotaxis protein